MPWSAASNLPIFFSVAPVNDALLVAEQLAFQQRLGQGGAVEADERPVLARAGVVDGAGHQLLADAALAADQHGGVGAGHPADLRLDLLDRRAVADQLALDLQLVAQRAVLGASATACRCSWWMTRAELLGDGDGELQVLGVERLVRVGAVEVDQAEHLRRRTATGAQIRLVAPRSVRLSRLRR